MTIKNKRERDRGRKKKKKIKPVYPADDTDAAAPHKTLPPAGRVAAPSHQSCCFTWMLLL